MTMREAESVLGVSYATVRNWVLQDHLPAVTIAGKRFILRKEFLAMFSKKPGGPTA
jgi:excisionase family DNA binding protein